MRFIHQNVLPPTTTCFGRCHTRLPISNSIPIKTMTNFFFFKNTQNDFLSIKVLTKNLYFLLFLLRFQYFLDRMRGQKCKTVNKKYWFYSFISFRDSSVSMIVIWAPWYVVRVDAYQSIFRNNFKYSGYTQQTLAYFSRIRAERNRICVPANTDCPRRALVLTNQLLSPPILIVSYISSERYNTL